MISLKKTATKKCFVHFPQRLKNIYIYIYNNNNKNKK